MTQYLFSDLIAKGLPADSRSTGLAEQGPLVLNAGFDHASAQAALDAGKAHAIAFGKSFLANPDLPHRSKPAAQRL